MDRRYNRAGGLSECDDRNHIAPDAKDRAA